MMLFLFLLLWTPCLPLPQFHFKPTYLSPASPLPYPYPSLYSSPFRAPFSAPFSSHFFSSPRSSLLASPKALCSSCSCSASFGCSYNCDKCPALCKTCSCTSSLGCHYNCDKCQKSQAGNGGEPGSGLLFPLPGGALSPPGNSVTGGELVVEGEQQGGQAGQGGLGQGEHILETQPVLVSETTETTGDCNDLVSKDLCQWGPSCVTMLAQLPQLSHCNYDCATCTLRPVEAATAEEDYDVAPGVNPGVTPGVTPPTAAQEAETASPQDQGGQEDYDVAPQPSPVLVEDDIVGQIEAGAWPSCDGDDNDVWTVLQCKNGHLVQGVVAEEGSGEEGSGEEDDKEEEDNEGGALEDLGQSSWTGFQTGPKCVAAGGPAKGQTCQFPFTHGGATYHGCAYKPAGSSAPVPPGSLGWCSTRTDINGYHINGLNNKYVGFCDNSCPSA